jgi:HprK-related kinase B
MIVDDYLTQANKQCKQSLLLDFSGYIIEFLTNSKLLLDELTDYYQHFLAAQKTDPQCIVEGLQSDTPNVVGNWQVKQPDPGKSKIKEHLLILDNGHAVKKVLTGVHLIFIGNRRVCIGPLENNPNQVVNFINNMHLEYCLRFGGQLFHASGVCMGENGLGMAGLSGKGKSTLALRLLQNGMDLVSNDRLVVSSTELGLRMQGVAKYPRINPGTIINQPELLNLTSAENLLRYRTMSIDELWHLEEKYDAFIEDTFDCAFKLDAVMKMFVVLDWELHSDQPTQFERYNPSACEVLVENVMKSPGIMLPIANKRIPQAISQTYIELLKQCDFYVLSGRVDFDCAAAQIKKVLAAY